MKTVNVKSLGECPYLVSLEEKDLVGKGSYAQVRIAYHRNEPGTTLAVKIFDLQDGRKYSSAVKQLSIVCSFPKHPNLVEYKRIKITSKHRLYIIMEKCQKSLRKELEESWKVNREYGVKESKIWGFLQQFVEGYKVLHGNKIVHRDIKPDNILIGQDGKYKISDFGLSEVISELQSSQQSGSKKTNARGSLCFMAPELLQKAHVHDGQQSSFKIFSLSDVYSLGVTLYFICFGRYPYIRPLGNYQTIGEFIEDVLSQPLKIPSKCPYSAKLIALIESMLEKQPKKRSSWEYIFFTMMETAQQLPSLLTLKGKGQEGEAEVLNKIKSEYNFRVVQISDAFLKNLSALDGDLYNSLNNQSLMIIDHVQAEIISKRQAIFFCDRIYSRLLSILQQNGPLKKTVFLFRNFSQKLLKANYLCSISLQRQFQECYGRVQKSEFMKLVVSKKYQGIRALLQQDLDALKEQMEQSGYQDPTQSLESINIGLYELCPHLIEALYELDLYQECREVDEMQKWLCGSPDSILTKIRKNQNSIKEFQKENFEITAEILRAVISKQYLYRFSQIDRKKNRN